MCSLLSLHKDLLGVCARVCVSARAQTSQSRKTVTATPYKAAELAHCVHTQFANHSNGLLHVCTV